jgi:hypothetical protein
MDTGTLDFIRDRFNSLEHQMSNGFDEIKENFVDHNKRIKRIEDTKLVSKGKMFVYSTIGGGIVTVAGFVIEAWIYK